ncbi:MAG: tetratricopeptide repeat protein [Candidatus Cloacimonadales bacterium]
MKKVYLLIGLLFALAGCAYYNTFFNAEVFFEEAQEMELRENGMPSPNAVQKYNKVIKKCGVIITDFPKSEYVDDAVMLLGRALYYKGTNYAQAAEKFHDILTYYPESEFVPEAHIYLAKISYQLGDKDEAFKQLKEFTLNNQFRSHHPQALLILADYYLEEENLSEADYYFNQIIQRYPDSEEYETAFFSRGKTSYLAENYQESNQVFLQLLKSRVSKSVKLDARYYIALNYLLMGDYQKAEKSAASLLKQEYRLSETAKINLILARAQAANGKVESAIEIGESIIENNKKSFISAETSFYLAEFYFELEKNYEKAIEYYNLVSSEKRNSPFIEKALAKSVVAAQIIQYYQPDSEISQEELVDQQFMLAEHYINTLSMPDSALVVYDNIIKDKERFVAQLDSLQIRETILQQELQDSLAVLQARSEISAASDSSRVAIAQQDTVASDSLAALPRFAEPDTLLPLHSFADSLQHLPQIDSLQQISQADSSLLKVATVDSTQYKQLQAQIEKLQQTISNYQDNFIPYTRFVKLWIYRNVIVDSTLAAAEYAKLQELGSDNKFAYAAERMWNDQPVEFSTYQLQAEKMEYEQALESLQAAPETSLDLLKPILADSSHSYYDNATFSAAFINYILLSDSTAARPYAEEIAAKPQHPFQADLKKFYAANKFIVYDRLPALEKYEAELQAAQEAEAKAAAEQQENSDQPASVIGSGEISWPTIRDELDSNEIIIEVEIDSSGKIGEIEVIQSLKADKPSLDKIVLAQVKNWEFSPALSEGKPVASSLELSFTYEAKTE